MDEAEPVAFGGTVIEWRGPAPFYFVALPEEAAATVRALAPAASYGWGCVPVAAAIDAAAFRTSLIPRGGGYLLPLKLAVRPELGAASGDRLEVALRVLSAPAARGLFEPFDGPG